MKKRFFITQILVFILLTACLVGVTYSWSTRPAIKGGYKTKPLTLTYSSVVNGHDCTAKTYQGTYNAETGKITYPDTVGSAIENLESTSYSAGDVLYFKTIIDNASETVDTNVSLLIDVTCSSSLNGNFAIGTSAPVIKEITYSSTAEGKWIPVVSQYEILKNNKSVSIDWYVKFNSAGTFSIDGFALANN